MSGTDKQGGVRKYRETDEDVIAFVLFFVFFSWDFLIIRNTN